MVRLMPIVVLLGSWLGVISCTQSSDSDSCSFDEFRVSARSQSENCPPVWFTFAFNKIICCHSVGKHLLDKKFIVLHW